MCDLHLPMHCAKTELKIISHCISSINEPASKYDIRRGLWKKNDSKFGYMGHLHRQLERVGGRREREGERETGDDSETEIQMDSKNDRDG